MHSTLQAVRMEADVNLWEILMDVNKYSYAMITDPDVH